MLSIFPDLLAFGLLAPFFLRITLGLILISRSYRKLKQKGSVAENIIGVSSGISGLFLIVGFLAQPAALLAMFLQLKEIVKKNRQEQLQTPEGILNIVLFIIALSLLFLGAGFYAFDLPL